MAFRQSDGKVAWSAGKYSDIVPATPLIINIGGQDQLVIVSADGVHGYDPRTGTRLWESSLAASTGTHVRSTPAWFPQDRLLFFASAFGSTVLQLTRTADKTEAKELWSSKRVRVLFGNVLRIGDSTWSRAVAIWGPHF